MKQDLVGSEEHCYHLTRRYNLVQHSALWHYTIEIDIYSKVDRANKTTDQESKALGSWNHQ